VSAFHPLQTLELALTILSGGCAMNELVIPPAAQRDAQSLELMRAWVAEEELHCSLRIGVYEDQGISEEKAWGTILADAARHIANALGS
jgi:hypothetical protein